MFATLLSLPSLAVGLPAGVVRSVERVAVGERTVRVDFFSRADSSAGTVLLLHGVGGIPGDGAFLRRLAVQLASEGFRAGIVHYFNVTGTLFTTPEGIGPRADLWREAVTAVVDAQAETHGPVGVVGYSLGGFLGVGVARDSRGVGALVVIGGGVLPEHADATPENLPPILVLHGEADEHVSVDRARALLAMAARVGSPVESTLLADERHALSKAAEEIAADRLTDFFHRRLGAGRETGS